jgi:hypothetical protein
MPLIAVTYAKGRPGVTTAALGLAAVAPAQARAVVVECDPAGGDLMRRHGLAAKPSIVDLAAAARGAGSADEAFTVGTQLLHVGGVTVPVVVAPAGGAQTRAALPELTGAGRNTLTAPERWVIADCGRLEVGSPVWPLLRLADVVLMLVRGRADELAHVREHLGALLDAEPGRLVAVLAPGGVYPPAEVAPVLATYVEQELARDPGAVAVTDALPEDRRAAGVLSGELQAGRRWQRLPLLKALRQVVDDLAPYLLVASVSDDGSRTETR